MVPHAMIGVPVLEGSASDHSLMQCATIDVLAPAGSASGGQQRAASSPHLAETPLEPHLVYEVAEARMAAHRGLGASCCLHEMTERLPSEADSAET